VKRAVALACADRAALCSYRQRLIANRETCTLFDIDGLARNLEQLYRDMAAAHENGATPQPNLENLDAYFDIGVRLDHDAAEIGIAVDYHGLYREKLRARDLQGPMRADGRLWDGSVPAKIAPQSTRTNRAA
jgi:hypothetical protein